MDNRLRETYKDINKLTEFIFNKTYNNHLVNKKIFEVLEFLKTEFKGKKINQFKKINSLLEQFKTEQIRISYWKEENKRYSDVGYLYVWSKGIEDKKIYFKENFEENYDNYKYLANKKILSKEEVYKDLEHKYKLLEEIKKIEDDFFNSNLNFYYDDFYNLNYKGKIKMS